MSTRKKKPSAVRAEPNATRSPAPASPQPGQHRTDNALRPSTPLERLLSRALDGELEWYFAYAETALGREDVGILPSYAAIRVLATTPTEEACRGKAYELAHAVRGSSSRAAPGRNRINPGSSS
jgi:hypothetical protein